MKTKFALAQLSVTMPDGNIITFWFDGNGKITVGNGTFVKPTANSFSLVQVQDCPFATPICKSVCYVHRLEKAEQEVHEKYQHNSRVIREVLADPAYRTIVEEKFALWIQQNCPFGFRWHVSGDIISFTHACFIRSVCDKAPNVPFWIYTRSFPYIKPLLDAKNLVINLSADKDNWHKALELHKDLKLRICYMTVEGKVPQDLPRGSVIFPSHELRGRDLLNPISAWWWQSITPEQKQMVCPPDFFGQSERWRCCPCKKCLVP